MAANDKIDILNIKIQEINLYKTRGQDKQKLSLVSQFVELNLYQSIYSPLIRAELLLHDAISLLTKYPMIGEETIEIIYQPTMEENSKAATVKQSFKWVFMVNKVLGMKPNETNRSQLYVLELYSIEMRVNVRGSLSTAFNDTYDRMIKKILTKDLQVEPIKLQNQDKLFEATTGTHHLIVPNMPPLEAINWLKMRSVPLKTDHSMFFFYETFNGFNFRTSESMFEKKWDDTEPTKYIFLSNMNEQIKKSILKFYGMNEHHAITSAQIHKRWDTLEKAALGYFENEYFDIDIYNKKVWSTPDQLKPGKEGKADKEKVFNMNSSAFIQGMQNQSTLPGTKTRVRYATSLNQGDTIDDDAMYRHKWGKAVRQQSALAQVEMTIVVPGDTRINAGDMIKIFIPEFHGFTDKIKEDKYIAGNYIITDVKHTVTTGMKHGTVLTINRNSYQESLLEIPPMEYGKQ